jgi:chemotaxis family two-component system sensor histidine kinase/response regulator PixL
MVTRNFELPDQAYEFFKQEALDLLQVLESGLLTLHTEHTVPKVHNLMRAAHSIKGGAASVGLFGIQKIAHKLEDILRALYRQEGPIDPHLEELLLQAYDCLRTPLVEQIQTGQYDEEGAWKEAEPVFEVLELILSDALKANAELPTAAELGVDVVNEVFAGDVTQSLAHLETILIYSEPALVEGELRAQAEVFIGMGELLSLPGFTAISQVLIQALNAQPARVMEIGQVAIANWQAAQEVILAGDRTEGGAPSDELLAFTLSPSSNSSLGHAHGSPPAALSEYSQLADIFGDFEVASNGAASASFDSLLENFTIEADLPFEIDSPANTLPAAHLPDLELSETESPTANLPNADLSIDLVPVSSTDLNSAPGKNLENALSIDPYLQATTTESVRVELSRLERLNNLIGELVTQENASSLQNQQLQSRLTGLQNRFERFEQLTKMIQDSMDQSLTAEVRSTKVGLSDTRLGKELPELQQSPIYALSEFDALQMDSYSDLYTIMQTALEEISQMGETLRDMMLFSQQTQQIQRQKQQSLKQIRNDLLWARMIPLADVIQRFPRMVRDMASQHHKQVRVEQIGATTLIDKGILARLYDPLVHLVRNAFDHGTESPENRLAQGKPPEATITIRAYHRGNQTFIEVRDDGRGIDPENVRSSAIAKGILSQESASTATPEQLYQLLFEPNFSTTATVTELSGRGMGLSTVQAQVKNLKGSISIASELGQGTTFTLRLPLTLTIAKLLVFNCDGNDLAIPADTLRGVVMASQDTIQTIDSQLFYRSGDQLIPLYPPSTFSNHYPLPKEKQQKNLPLTLSQQDKTPLLLIGETTNVIALQVDQIFNEQDLVIKPFGKAVPPPPYFYGCTILADGSLVPVIDGTMLVDLWKRPIPEAQTRSSTGYEGRSPIKTHSYPAHPLEDVITILVIDDALTARQTLTTTLLKAGYQVIQAGDGREALEKMQQETTIRAVFCDVEMPVMNGFEFLNLSRKKYPATQLPIIVLTSRGGEKHRGIAKLLGANHYLSKPYLEQELLMTLRQCLQEVASVS